MIQSARHKGDDNDSEEAEGGKSSYGKGNSAGM